MHFGDWEVKEDADEGKVSGGMEKFRNVCWINDTNESTAKQEQETTTRTAREREVKDVQKE